MSNDVTLHANFLRGIAIILFVLLGVVPFWMLLDWGLVTVHPYISLISMAAGGVVYHYSRKIRKLAGS